MLLLFGGGPQNYQRDLNTSTSFSAGFVRSMARSIFPSLSFSPSLTTSRLFARTLPADLVFGDIWVEGGLIDVSLLDDPVVYLIRRVGLNRAASFTLTPSFARATSAYRSLSPSLTLAPGLSRVASRFAALTSSLSFSASLTASRMFYRVLSATLSAATASLSKTSQRVASLSSTLTLSPGTFVRAMSRSVASSLGLSTVSLSKVASRFKSLPSTLSFSLAWTKRVSKEIEPTLTFSPTFSRAVTAARSLAASFTLSGALSKAPVIARALNATLSFSSSLVKDLVSNAQTYYRTMMASLTFGSSPEQWIEPGLVDDALLESGAANRLILQVGKLVPVTLNLPASFTRAFSSWKLDATLSFLNEWTQQVISNAQTYTSTLTASVGLSASVLLTKTMSKAFAVSMTVTSSLSKRRIQFVSMLASFMLASTLTRRVTAYRILAETLGLRVKLLKSGDAIVDIIRRRKPESGLRRRSGLGGIIRRTSHSDDVERREHE